MDLQSLAQRIVAKSPPPGGTQAENIQRAKEMLGNFLPDAKRLGTDFLKTPYTLAQQAVSGVSPNEMLGNAVIGAAQSMGRTITDPTYNRQHPAEAALNILMAIQGMKALSNKMQPPQSPLDEISQGKKYSELSPEQQQTIRQSTSLESGINAHGGFAPGERLALDKQIMNGQLKYEDVYGANGMKKMTTSPMNRTLDIARDVVEGRGAIPKALSPFGGYKDMTTGILDDLKGKSLVNKQYIEDLVKQPSTRQAERDLALNVLKDYPQGKIPVKEFADKMKTDLLPLERLGTPEGGSQMTRQYEGINLPVDKRGATTNYSENIYESPIKTSAGNVHFNGQSDNYFAHTRTEDLMPESYKKDEFAPAPYIKGTTRRVLEIQSDLFQKGRLDQEALQPGSTIPNPEKVRIETQGRPDHADLVNREQHAKEIYDQRNSEISKLKPYENTWHERIIREEVKKAAQDNMQQLQFPTGETAMKVEGLGRVENWKLRTKLIKNKKMGDSYETQPLNAENIKPGAQVYSENQGAFIVTKDLGEGKFRAVPARGLEMENDKGIYKMAMDRGYINKQTGDWNTEKAFADKEIMKKYDEVYGENFDASGKIDTANPIYKFYEGDVQQFLKRAYPNMKRITDPQGVQWFQVPITPDLKTKPVKVIGKSKGGDVA